MELRPCPTEHVCNERLCKTMHHLQWTHALINTNNPLVQKKKRKHIVLVTSGTEAINGAGIVNFNL